MRAGLSSCGTRALERRLSSCGAWAELFRGMWDLPGPGLEPMSPALAGGFLTTAPPGKSPETFFSKQNKNGNDQPFSPLVLSPFPHLRVAWPYSEVSVQRGA